MTNGNTPQESATTMTAEQTAEQIAERSPEGQPAYPGFGHRRIALAFLALLCAGAALGAVVGAIVSPRAGLGFALVVFVLLLINPETWAAFMRAKERKKISQDSAKSDTPARSTRESAVS